MSTAYISAELRRIVRDRAGAKCEYCLIPATFAYYGCHVDHVVSEKHGGATDENNLAYSCAYCNRNKGSDLGSLSATTGKLIRFYNPRKDRWATHFKIDADGVTINPLTPTGEVTARIFGFNQAMRLQERRILAGVGQYPP